MKYFCYQGNDYDCGFAALKMLLATLNKNKSFLYIDKVDKRSSFSFKDLIEIGNTYNLKLCAYEYEKDKYQEVKTPFLALFDCNHCVLIKRFLKGKVEIYDPGKGIYTLKNSKFSERWSGKVLEVESFTPITLSKKEKKIIPLKKNILSFGISSFAIAFLIAGFFFVKGGSYVFIPIIFLALFAICELVEKWYLIKEIDFFDKEYIPKIFTNKNCDVKECYRDYVTFKKDYFCFGRKIYICFALILIITVTLILNNPINGFAVLFLLGLTIFEKAFLNDKTMVQSKNLLDLETTLVKDDNPNLVRDLLFINQNASDYALRISLRKCINTFIIVILSFLLMIFSGEVSVNFILFYFGVFYILMDNMDIALSFKENNQKYQISKARFLDSINL